MGVCLIMQQCKKMHKNFVKSIFYLIISIFIFCFPYQLFSRDDDANLNDDRSAKSNLVDPDLGFASSGVTKLNFVPNEAIIKFKSGVLKSEPKIKDGKVDTSIESVDFILNQFKISEIKRLIPKEVTELKDLYHIKISPLFNITDLISLLKFNKYIELIDPNYLFYTCDVPNDYNPAIQWGLAKIKATQAWDHTHGSTNVVIAVIDTGVDYNHPDLANNIWTNPNEIPGNGVDDDNNGYIDDVIGWDFVSISSNYNPPPARGEDIGPPDNDPMDFQGHGTHCSGIASAVTNNETGIAGTGWNCKIMAVRAGYKNAEGNGSLALSDVIAGIYYAADNGANIISMSWGSTSNPSSLLTAINYAKNKGCALVAAAGNENSSNKYFPAAYDGVIAVAASDQNDAKASFSNYGTWVDVAAPGVGIRSTMFNDIYANMSGTSMATPFVAGIAGLILSINPLLNASDIASKITSYADNVGWAKRVNAYQTVLNSIPLTVSISPDAQVGQVVTATANVDISANTSSLILYYKQGGKANYQTLGFSLQSGTLKKGTWSVNIPANQVTTKGIIYYVELTDVNNKKCYYGSVSSPYFIQVDGNITILLRSSQNSVNIVAPSVITDDKTVAGNFSSLGTYGINWIAWRWNTSVGRWEVSQTFRDFPVSGDPFDVATSWWITFIGDGTIQPVSIHGTSVNSSDPYKIILKSGWNCIANPFDFPVAWSDTSIKVKYLDQEVTPTQAKANFWVDNRLIYFDNAQNHNVTRYSYENPPYSIPAKQGFWLYSAVNNAEILISSIEYLASPAPPSIPNNDIDSWKVILSLKNNMDENRLEITANKREIKNYLGSFNPPSNPFSTSFMDVTKCEFIADQFIWEFEVTTSIDSYLQWNFVNVPDDYSLIVEEYDLGRIVDLRTSTNIFINGRDHTRKFVLKATRRYIPDQTKFFVNYPNPFNPETWIPYQLANDSEVTVKIYSSTGQIVRKFELGYKPAGFYTTKDKAIYWDGKNDFGETVSSGVYFYNIKAGNKVFSNKMVMLK